MNKKMKILYFYPNRSTFIERDLELLKREFQVEKFELGQGSKLKLPFQLLKQLGFLLQKAFSCDVIICQFAGYSSLLPILFGRLLKKPRLLIIAGTDAASFPKMNYGNYRKNGLLNFFSSASIKNASHLFPVHERLMYQAYAYHEYGAPEQGINAFVKTKNPLQFTPLYYGYDSNYFSRISDNERPPLSFITIGNLAMKNVFLRKGIDLILELAKNNTECQFTIVGWDGVSPINCTENVQLLPFMDQDGIVKILNEHRYYMQLSLMEGFPNALCEAMLCGCVPIGSDVSGIPDIIGDTGYILDKHDIEPLQQLLNVIKGDEKLDNFESKSLLARNRIVENYTYERRFNTLKHQILKETK